MKNRRNLSNRENQALLESSVYQLYKDDPRVQVLFNRGVT